MALRQLTQYPTKPLPLPVCESANPWNRYVRTLASATYAEAKCCTDCNHWLDKANYDPDKRTSDGLKKKCRTCAGTGRR